MADFIDHVNLRIPEEGVDEALNFYRDVLGLEPWKLKDYRNGDRTSFFFRIGENALLNMRPKSNFERPSRNNYDHFCLVLDRDFDVLRQDLSEKDFKILREGKPLGSQGRAPAWYVKDPFGYVIEVKASK